MRIERWYWLFVFCMVSLCLHASLKYVKGSLIPAPRIDTTPAGLEVTLAPPDAPALKPQPGPLAPPAPETKPVAKEAPTKEEVSKTEVKTPMKVASRDTRTEKPADTEHVRLPAPKDNESLAPIKPAPEPKADQTPDDAAVQNEAPPVGLPDAPKATSAPRVTAAPKALTVPSPVPGGGSLAPDKTLTGKNGAAGPEAPPEDIIYSGGGAGGINLPKAPAKIGGGGGNAIIAVENPLAKEAVPEDKPGLGPGTGGGAGTGSGAGAGFRVGKGVGTRSDGRDALATLNSKPGNGIGAGTGSNTGTKAPGGGKGTGAEQPGTGGEGTGYGRGKGIDFGNSAAPHAETGGLSRGIPFGDITGMLGKGKGAGGGLPGRGGVFGQAPRISGGGGGKIHIIYVLDTSGSMKDFGKIFKAEDALKRALVELRPTDTFNVMNFDQTVHVMTTALNLSEEMLPATRENVMKAWTYIDNLRLNPYTNVSAAMARALSEETVTHIFLMSDGEPNAGISDFMQLRVFIKERNTRKVQINTLALGAGERFPGMRLLRSIADDNDGQYSYVNLLNDTASPGK